jgi:3-oxoacyl-[acyl-carrier protein] reductase
MTSQEHRMEQGPVLVVGGSRGIGRAIVEALDAERRPVAFTWATSVEAAAEIEGLTEGRAHGHHFDIRDRGRVAGLIAEVEERSGPIEGLVHCAGVRRDTLLALASDEDWEIVLDTNLAGAFRVCRAVVPGMLRRRRGSIVNISSLSAFHGVAGQTLYAASKAGLIALSRSLARECGRRGVRVNAVVPGYVPTDFVADLPDHIVAGLRSTECLRDGTAPRDVADTVVFLLSDRARAITGQTVVVDAGGSV